MDRFLGLLLVVITVCSAGCGRESKESYVAKGNALFAQGKFEDAALAYRKAAQKDIRFAEAHYRIALAELAQRRTEKAIPSLRRALALAPDNDDARAKLAEIALGRYLTDPRRPEQLAEEVQSHAKRLLARNPNSFDGLRFLGHIAVQKFEDAQALEYFEKALAIKRGDPEVTLAAVDLLAEKDWPRAEQLGKELLAAQPTYIAMYDLLYLQYKKRGLIDESEKLLHAKRQHLPKDGTTLLQLAVHYSDLKRPQDAKRFLEELLARPADFPKRFLQVGDFYAARGDTAEAVRHYERGADSDPGAQKEYQTRIANLLRSEGKTAEAAAVIERGLQNNPRDLDMRAARATIWLESGMGPEVERSVNEFQALVKEAPDNAFFRFSLARGLLQRGDRRGGEVALREAVRRQWSLAPAQLLLAEIELEAGRAKEAIGHAAQALQSQPKNPNAELLIVRGLQLSGRLMDARKEIDRMVKQYPQFRPAYLQSAYIMLDEKRYRDAEALFSRLMQSGKDDAAAIAGLAEVYAIQNQLPKAVEVVRTELGRHPQSPRLRLLLAQLAARIRDYPLAMAQYQALLQGGTRTEQVYRSLAETQFNQGDVDGSIASLREAQKLSPASADLVVTMASLLDRKGRSNEAQGLYRRALELDPINAIAMNNLAYSLAQAGGDLDEALRLAKAATQRANDPNFADTLGWIYLQRQEHDVAIQVFRNLVEKQPANTTFRLHLGMALLGKGDRAAARQHLEQALAQNPPQEEAALIRSALGRT